MFNFIAKIIYFIYLNYFIFKYLLNKSFVGAKALEEGRPVCHGRYNITDAIQGAAMYNNLTQCDSMVKSTCNFTLPDSEQTEVEKCYKLMTDFR